MSELKKGKKIEKEHKKTVKAIKKNPKIQDEEAYGMIAKDHLKEDPKYYTKLDKYVESITIDTFESAFEEVLMEKKKKKKSSKNKWTPKKQYKNSTYGFYPHSGIGFDGATGDAGGGE